MTTFNVSKAWIVDKDGHRRELIPVSNVTFAPKPEGEPAEPEKVYDLSGSLSESFTVELTGEAAQPLLRMFRQMDYKRWVAPLRYRLQPTPRSRSIKVGGAYLTSKAAFMHRLLGGEDT